MIDFTNCAVNKFKAYGGANGNKINVIYDDTSYMLKFPPVPSKSSTPKLRRFMTAAPVSTRKWMCETWQRCWAM